MRLRVSARFAAIACLLFAAALYLPSLGNALTNWDDGEYVLANPVASQGLRGVPAAFTTFVDGAWYPLTHASYALLHAAVGTEPFAYHLLQWLVFAAAAALVPLALAAFGVPPGAALLATLLWIAHPFRTEAVSWVANLKDTLSLLGVAGALALYGRERRAAAAAAFTGALLAKSAVFPLALLFPLIDLLRGTPARRAAAWSLAFLAPAALAAGITGWAHAHDPAAVARARPGGDLLAALPTVLWKPLWYLWRILWPVEPRAIYARDVLTWSDPRLLLVGVASAAVIGASLWLRSRARDRSAVLSRSSVAVLAYLLPLLPVTGLVPLRFFAADRYTLLPSLVVAVGIALALHHAARRLAFPAWAAGLGAVALMVPANLARQAEWRDGISLWTANARVEPDVWEVHYNLAGALGGEGRWQEAISALETTHRLNPSSRRVLGDLAFAHAAALGKDAEFIGGLLTLLKAKAMAPRAFLDAARVLVSGGDTQLARVLLELGSRPPATLQDRALAQAMLMRLERPEGNDGQVVRLLNAAERELPPAP